MQARCPHCSTVFNTERAGIQFCPNCGQQINVPDPGAPAGAGPGAGVPPPPPPPLPPGAPGSAPGAGGRGPVPWEERQQRGPFGAFFENWKQVVMDPEAFWRRMRPDGPLGDALFFGWICFGVYLLLNLPLQMLGGLNGEQMQQVTDQVRQALDQAKDLPPELRRLMLQLMSFGLGKGTAAFTVGTVILYPVRVIIGAALIHLCCLIFGVAKNGFTATVRVMTYAQAPYLLGWVPCVGQIVAPIYGLVLLIWGLARAHDSTVWRAVAAILVPVLVLCCCCGVGFGVLIALAGGAAAKMQ